MLRRLTCAVITALLLSIPTTVDAETPFTHHYEPVSFETSRTITCAILFLETAGIGLGMKLGHGWSNEASGIMFGISGGVLVGCLTLPNAKPTERRVLRNRRRY